MDEISDDDYSTFLPAKLAGRRPSFSPSSDNDDLLHIFPVPSLKRSSTNGSGPRSHRHIDIPVLSSSASHWNSPSSSLLSQSRPSLVEGSRLRRFQSDMPSTPEAIFSDLPTINTEPHSPDEGPNFKRSLEINMKDLVGDAVGNMSISPSSRDIVLAARKGLFIIDLEHPFEVPRFLPQGGTWDVADVQWNPHPSRSQYIVSTSSEKMLIWNLGITGKTSIEHILKSHYRAITDFNWHTTECDVVASTGIDSWIWVWDLRNPRKPAFGLSAFQAAGTQVKWNRQDGNFLASSHGNEVLIWDRRKGSLPVARIAAHSAKIYGIDWSHHLRNEMVTCSLDMTIKSWDINEVCEPKAQIQTNYPVWRARNLPFGQGVLSLPQRGETRLEMYARSETPTLVETFEGHSDVVKEFVWRKGAAEEFQLITWSKDRTLRFWPVTTDTMQRVGHMPEVARGRALRIEREPTLSYRNPPEGPHPTIPQLLSAPIGNRGILAEVRAGPPPRSSNLITHPQSGSSARGGLGESSQRTPTLTDTKPVPVASRARGETMSLGPGKNVAGMDAFAWLVSIKVGGERGTSSGATSAEQGSSNSSRLPSASRGQSMAEGDGESARQRSASRGRPADDRRESESAQSLQDEITTVLTKLTSSKVKLEKHDLTKKRTCTLGLNGPWGQSSSVFMRVTFTFPQKYPHAPHPEGTPFVALENNPLISPRDRHYILKRLKVIRETKRPCLEACLRFLLFHEDVQAGHAGEAMMDSESSDEGDDLGSKRKGKELTVSILRNHKNLAEPRTSQGAFGPNGELICFFRAPPRIVRNVLRGLTETPGANEDQQSSQQQESLQQSRLFQSPALVSDAIRRLRLSARDQIVLPIDRGKPENDLNILRTMTNLLTVPQHKIRRDTGGGAGSLKNRSLLPTRRSNVFMMDTMNISGPDRVLATRYVFRGESVAEVCEANAQVAKQHGRYDHERIFMMLKSLFHLLKKPGDGLKVGGAENTFVSDALGVKMVNRLYTELAKDKDVQMLAMLSIIILQTPYGSRKQDSVLRSKASIAIADLPPLKTGGFDYFTLTRSINAQSQSPRSPQWPSPVVPPIAPSVSSSNSSRGSWSSLFNTGSVRQLMHGLQDGLTTPTTEPLAFPGFYPEPLSKQNSNEKLGPSLGVSGLQKKRQRKDSAAVHSPSAVISKSWNEGQPTQAPRSLTVSFSSAGNRRSGYGWGGGGAREISSLLQDKKKIVFEPPVMKESPPPGFMNEMIQQLHRHVYVYAELLFRWEAFNKRLELLKSAGQLNPPLDQTQHRIGLVKRCARPDCSVLLDERMQKGPVCGQCSTPVSSPGCTICRLPVRGLSHICLRCCHVTHISCWDTLSVPLCPTGCGCWCTGMEGVSTRPSTRLGLSPASNSLMLSSAIS